MYQGKQSWNKWSSKGSELAQQIVAENPECSEDETIEVM